MFTARIFSRALAHQQSTAATRSLIQRRLNSSSTIQSVKAEGNAFIKEREAVKKHAAESSGTLHPFLSPPLQMLIGNRTLAQALHLVLSSSISRTIRHSYMKTRSGTIPFLIIASINAYNLWNEHWEHWSHMPPLEERPEYPYQNIRVKNFFWGDGDKTIL
jgi:cytochrome c oxidase subunit 6a